MPVDEADILLQAERWRAEGRGVALATVVETIGSAPRPVGSHLLVEEGGGFCGSVSAGCVEADVIAAALDCIGGGAPRLLDFGGPDEPAWRRGLTCGGRIVVRVEALDDAKTAIIAASNRAFAARRASAILSPLAGGAWRFEDGATCASGVVENDGARCFIDARAPAPRLLIIGAVHVAQALAPMARVAGFDVTVIDPRGAYATPERFADVRIDPRWPDEAMPDIGLDAFTAVVVLTHDAKIDDAALKLALTSNCFYVGALGSRATHARRLARLVDAGVSRDALARLRAPVGLDIGAVSPADIAVSTLAEIIMARGGKPLRDAPATPVEAPRPSPQPSPRERGEGASICAVVLAAGRGARFGANKLLAPYDGAPLLLNVVAAAAASRLRKVIVVTGHDRAAVEQTLKNSPVTIAHNADHESGVASSLRAGIEAAGDAAAAIIFLGDMPLVAPDTVDALIDAFKAAPDAPAIVPTFKGRRGNPVLLGAKLFPRLATLTGDDGARKILRDLPGVIELPVEDDGVLYDIDHPEDLRRN